MDVLDVIGDFGKFQMEVGILMAIRSVLISTTFYMVNIISSPVDHWCSPVTPYLNLSANDWKECCVPKENSEYSQCQRYEFSDNHTIINYTVFQCQKWDYERENQMSLRAEWDLVCDRKWLLSLLYLMFFTGNMISYPIVGSFADRFGRKPSMLLGCTGLGVTHIAVSLSNSFTMLLISRFLTGVAYSFIQSASITLFLEVSGRKQRALLSLITGVIWSLSSGLALIISSYFYSWRYFNLLGCIYLPYLFLLWKFCPESPRWLVACRKWDKAKEVLVLASRKNGVMIHDMKSVMESLEEKLDTLQGKQEKNTLKALLKKRKLLFVYMVLLFSFITNRLITTGFVISLHALGGNFQTNFLISSGFSVMGSIISTLVQSTVTNRRLTALLANTLVGIVFLSSTAIGEDLLWLRITVAMLGKFLNTVIFSTLLLFVGEVSPTKMRSTISSICQTVGRAGAAIASFTDLLSQVYGQNASLVLFGVLALLSAAAFFFVTQVDNRNLPDTVEEANRNMTSKSRSRRTEVDSEEALSKHKITLCTVNSLSAPGISRIN